MEGPTPVSALIHAATMVTAGVFLLIRSSPLLEYSDTTLTIITIIGALTAFFAATVGLVQNATLGAGTTLTKDAPENQLTVTRVKQTSLHWQRPVKTKK